MIEIIKYIVLFLFSFTIFPCVACFGFVVSVEGFYAVKASTIQRPRLMLIVSSVLAFSSIILFLVWLVLISSFPESGCLPLALVEGSKQC